LSNHSISVVVNLGRLSGSNKAYLFVFDANNKSNEAGYPIVFESDKHRDISPDHQIGR